MTVIPAEVLSMVSEANFKVDQVHTANFYLKASTGKRVMRAEDSIMQVVKGMETVDLTVHKAEVDGIDLLHRCKDLDQVLRIFLLDEKLFVDYSKIKFMSIAVGGNYSKEFFKNVSEIVY